MRFLVEAKLLCFIIKSQPLTKSRHIDRDKIDSQMTVVLLTVLLSKVEDVAGICVSQLMNHFSRVKVGPNEVQTLLRNTNASRKQKCC